MSTKNYKIVVPLSTSQCLEIVPKQYPTDSQPQPDQLSKFKIYESDHPNFEDSAEINQDKMQNTEILKILKVAHKGLSRYFERHETYIVPSANGFQLIRSNQILYFEYSKAKKHWVAVLTNLSCIILKSNTTALSILEYSNSYIRINQQCIINLNYLSKIDLNVCVLTVQTNTAANLNVTRSYLKNLIETMRVI